MNDEALSSGGLRGWLTEVTRAWDRFWFTPRAPESLALLRILCGAMLVYVHVIWLSQLSDFFGPQAWIDGPTSRFLHELDYSRTYLAYISSPWIVGLHQVVAIAVCGLMMVGWRTRLVVPLAWFMTLMVCHRQTGALFGLDQIVMMVAMYLMLCPCGAAYSLDALRQSAARLDPVDRGEPIRGRTSAQVPAGQPWPRESVAINVSTRLLQLHLCIIYLFGGLSKLRGDFWWEGSAMWWSISNYEYQSLNVLWLGRWPLLIALVTHATIFWETFYAALIWPRLTRPIMLAMAIFVHGGIAVVLGMPTFGFMMIFANLAFVSPDTTRRWTGWLEQRVLRWRPSNA